MKSDCHIHMLLDGADWRSAIDGHRRAPDEALIRKRLEAYARAGFTYLRDGGDRWGVGLAARELAEEYGITYRTPLAPLCRAGHYGAFIGKKFENLRGFSRMVEETRKRGGDFIKVMVSGLMDFDRFGILSEESLPEEEIATIVRIAHDQGFSIMLHANGPRAVEAAAAAGADSVEHGAYLEHDTLAAMAENGTVWCPTLSAIGNLRGKGRFKECAVQAIYQSAQENLRSFARMGGLIAPGSDAGAWAVPHVSGGLDEYRLLLETLGEGGQQTLFRGIQMIQSKF